MFIQFQYFNKCQSLCEGSLTAVKAGITKTNIGNLFVKYFKNSHSHVVNTKIISFLFVFVKGKLRFIRDVIDNWKPVLRANLTTENEIWRQ